MITLSDAYPAAENDTRLRLFDARRDLGAVADLVEVCFNETLDADGRDYLGRMRSAANSVEWLNWLATAEWAMPAMQGYVWVEDGRLVGNASLVPYYLKGRRLYLIANVAVHPDYRRRGIGRALTLQAAQHAQARDCPSVWLQVRADNPAAVALYRSLGFEERASRSTWITTPKHEPAPATVLPPGCHISELPGSAWPQVRAWLEHSYPPALSWHLTIRIAALRPGWIGGLTRFVFGSTVRQWTLVRQGQVLAMAAWQTTDSYANAVFLAAPPDGDPALLTALLQHLRTNLYSSRPITLDYPSETHSAAIEAAGFSAQQTLIWMELPFR